MKNVESTAFTLALTTILTLLLVMAWQLGPGSRLAPVLVAAGTLALLACQLGRDVSTLRPGHGGPTSQQGERKGFLWVVALPVLIYLLGCLAAVLIHTLLFMRMRDEKSWLFAAFFALAAAIPVYALSLLTLRTELLEGVLLKWPE